MKRLIFAMLAAAAALATAADAQRGQAGRPSAHPQPSTVRTTPPVTPVPSLGPSLGFTPPPNFSRSTDTVVLPATTLPRATANTEATAATTEEVVAPVAVETRPPPPPPPDPPPSDWGCSDQDDATACDGPADNITENAAAAVAESGGEPSGGGFSWWWIGLGSLAAAAFVVWIYRAGRNY